MVYNYTRPRGPIAAMYGSPGPCYALPSLIGQNSHDPRSTHARAAQWSFGVRHGKFTNESSPGPCYFPDPKYLKNGKDGTPHFSLSSRHKEIMIFSNPGPGAYSVQNGDNYVYNKAPAYSLSSRNKEFKTDVVPGPNRYNLDSMLGKTVRSEKQSAPSYSLSSRSKQLTSMETPGAGAYKITDISIYKDSAPKYTLLGRTQLPTDNTRKPGPGAYYPEKVTFDKRSEPQFSFGIRHSQYKGEFMDDNIIE